MNRGFRGRGAHQNPNQPYIHPKLRKKFIGLDYDPEQEGKQEESNQEGGNRRHRRRRSYRDGMPPSSLKSYAVSHDLYSSLTYL